MKRLVKFTAAVVALSALAGSAFAATPGAYVGAGVGYDYLNNSNLNNYLPKPYNNVVKFDSNKGNVGGRAFAGYNFNPFLGIEGGYDYYGQPNFNVKNAIPAKSASVDERYQTFSLVGKAYLPIQDSGFNLYALGGAAYVNDKVTGNGLLSDSVTTNEVRPKFGLGASYDIPDSQWTTSLEFARVQGNSKIASANSVMLNVSYNFG
jgi:OmpA-OmpF porin, OOP family